MNSTGLLLIFVALLVLRVPLAFSMGLAGLAYIVAEGLPLIVMAQRMTNSINSFPLLAVPLFILAGNVFNVSGVTSRIFHFARLLMGRQPGGMAQVNVLASLIFSGMSGAALADIGGLGNIEIKAMSDQGYRRPLSAAITTASATIGPLFPPSVPLIIYAVVAETSALQILLAGVVPALLLTALLMLQIAYLARRQEYPRDTVAADVGSRRKAFVVALPALLAPALLVGGLLVGTFGATEIAAVVFAYSLFLGFAVYRDLTFARFVKSVRDSARTTSAIVIIAAGSALFAFALTVEGVPQQLTTLMLGVTDSKIVLLLIANVILLLTGMIMDTIAALLVVVPLLVPPLVMVGVDPIHLGIVVVFNLMIGMLTPPVGMSLYLISDIAKVRVEAVVREVLPFLVPLFVALIALTLAPQLSLWLPTLFR